MREYRQMVWLLLLGSIWGMSELIFGRVLIEANVTYSSIWLNGWAFFILAVARGIMNKPGSSTALGAIAALFKLVNAAPFFCHLLGIFLVGFAFDIAYTMLMKHKKRIYYWSSLVGVVGAYSGYALFALIITYIIRYKYWAMEGLSKVLNHIFVTGSFAALIALGVVPLGFWFGIRGRKLTQNHWRWAFRGALVAIIVIWTLGRLAR
jgi:hypothetical protein